MRKLRNEYHSVSRNKKDNAHFITEKTTRDINLLAADDNDLLAREDLL